MMPSLAKLMKATAIAFALAANLAGCCKADAQVLFDDDVTYMDAKLVGHGVGIRGGSAALS